MKTLYWGMAASLVLVFGAVGCGDDDDNDASGLGVGAECSAVSDCEIVMIDDEEVQLACLTQFTAGYCAIEGCETALDCPTGSTCVAHDDGANYCFLECTDKAQCNENRSEDAEANCSANFDYANEDDAKDGVKACIPPSSGDSGEGGAGGATSGKPDK